MRVAIDARKLHDFGIGTYVRNLVHQLARLDHETEYVLLCQPGDSALAESLGANFHAVTERAGNYSFGEQFLVPFDLGRTGAQLFHAPHYVLPPLTPCRAIVTIHDCIHLRFPQYLPNRFALTYARAQIWYALRRASRVLTVSEASKQDILRFFDVPDDAQDASYFAASARIASFSRTVCEAICSIYVLLKALPSPRRKKAPIS